MLWGHQQVTAVALGVLGSMSLVCRGAAWPLPMLCTDRECAAGCQCFQCSQCSQQPPLLSFAHCSGTGEGHKALVRDVIPLARSTGLHLGAEHPHGLRFSPTQGLQPRGEVAVWLMPWLTLTPQRRSGFAVLGQDAGAGCVPLTSRLPSHCALPHRSALLRAPSSSREMCRSCPESRALSFFRLHGNVTL